MRSITLAVLTILLAVLPFACGGSDGVSWPDAGADASSERLDAYASPPDSGLDSSYVATDSGFDSPSDGPVDSPLDAYEAGPYDAAATCDMNGWGATPGALPWNGGDVLSSQVPIYLVWYGDWEGAVDGGSNASRKAIVERFASAIGGSPWLSLLGSMCSDDAGPCPTTQASLAASVEVGYPYGTALVATTVQASISGAISSGKLPDDPSGLYVLLASADVSDLEAFGTFCGSFCGYHWAFLDQSDAGADASSAALKYAYVGDPTACPYDCSPLYETASCGVFGAPNGDWGADGMTGILGHELAEAITDPLPFTGYYDSTNGGEVGDKCAWRFEPVYSVDDGGAYANVSLGGHDYLIQQMWHQDPKVLGGGECLLGLPSDAGVTSSDGAPE